MQRRQASQFGKYGSKPMKQHLNWNQKGVIWQAARMEGVVKNRGINPIRKKRKKRG